MMRFFRRSRDEEMREEMGFHVDMEAADLEKSGMPAEEARRRALATFGGVRRYHEEGHEARGGAWIEDAMRDTRYALRSLARTPGYTAVVVLTLALGIAAVTSIFSVANGVLFTDLRYRDPSRLMVLWDGLDWMGVPEAWVTGPEVVRLRRETTRFEGFAAIRSGSVTLGGENGFDPQRVAQSAVSANFFQVLGVGPALGRAFARGEDAPNAARLALVSHRLWTQRFGGEASLLGKTIMIDGKPATVVGILPPSFRFTPLTSLASASADADVYTLLPDTLDRLPITNHSIGVLARVREDVSVASARSELAALSQRVDKEGYGTRGFKFVPIVLRERMVREVRPALLVLLTAVGLLMLIMCANLAVLALVRAARREHELTVRRAIGASPGRVARQILTETLLLSLAGAVVGAFVGVWALRALLAIAPPGLPRRDEIGIDLRVVALTVTLALVVGILMGIAPTLRSARLDLAVVLRERSVARAGGRARRVLVFAQVALSTVLLAGTGLLLGSFVRLTRVDAGFDPTGVLTLEVMASRAVYTTGLPVVDAFSHALDALRAIPGVTAVGASEAPPLSAGPDQSGVRFPTSSTNTGDREHDTVLGDVGAVTPGYLRAAGIALLSGQDFTVTARDSVSSKTAMIDDVLASRYFPKGNAVGQPVLIDGDTLRVVGVVRHVRMYNLQDEGRGQVWVTHLYAAFRLMTVVIRTSGDPMKFVDAARRVIRTTEPSMTISAAAPLSNAIRNALAERRLVLTLVGAFAVSALLLAALGVYGVTASAVTQRTHELGIRMALGADRASLVASVLAEPARLVVSGLIVGLGGAFLAARAARGLLYGVSAGDPSTIVGACVVLLAIAILASVVPARRATRVDPMTALRSD